MKLLLVDGHYYAFRSFYAIRNLTNSRGEPTNAVYGTIKTLQRMLQEVQPDLAAVIYDEGPPQERLRLQEDYKANRSETPEELSCQIEPIFRVVEALGFARLSTYGEEADDLIASYTQAALKEDHEVVLATNDKDLMQLVGPRCCVYQSGKEGMALLGPAEVEQKWGVPPQRIGDVLALTGDSVDNIPGVPGFGPKTAAKLVLEFGSVERLLASLDQVKSARHREALETHRDRVLLNQKMVALRDALDLPRPIEELTIRPDFEAQVREFKALEFRTFLREASQHISPQSEKPQPGQADSTQEENRKGAVAPSQHISPQSEKTQPEQADSTNPSHKDTQASDHEGRDIGLTHRQGELF